MSSVPQVAIARRTYRMQGVTRFILGGLGLLLTIIGAVLSPATISSASNYAFAVLGSVTFLVFGVYTLALVLRSRLVIDGNRITVRGAFRERSADLSEIEGFRSISVEYGSRPDTRLYLKEGRSTISIPSSFAIDDDYRAWLQQLTDLDSRDREALLDEISKQESLGATPQDRLDALANAKTWAVFLSIVTGAAAAALVFRVEGIEFIAAALVVIAPVIALLLVQRSPLLYAMPKPKADPRAELSYVLLLSAVGLLLHNKVFHFLSVGPLLLVVVPVGVVYAAMLYGVSRKDTSMPASFIGVLILVGLYSFGFGVAADTMLDRGKPDSYAVQVLDKHTTHGNRSTGYYLQVSPWGPVDSPNRVTVTSQLYQAENVGDQVRVVLHPGVMRIPWYQVVNCATQPAP